MRAQLLQKGLFSVSILALAYWAIPAIAQDTPQQHVVRRADGGTSGRMESIFISPKPRAPFSFTLVTEWTRPMANGGTFTLANQRRIARDSRGRIYQERWILVPKGGKIPSHMDVFQITDPRQHTWYNCYPDQKVCDLFPYTLSADADFEPAISKPGPLPDGDGFIKNEDLGLSSVEGIDTHGYRDTITVNAGAMGNDQPMISTREFWFSPHLAINLQSLVDTPNSGKQVFTAKEVSTSEPEPSLFEIPQGYKIVDRTKE